ncbi:MAG: ABC transporter permease [Deinococcota bacterium]
MATSTASLSVPKRRHRENRAWRQLRRNPRTIFGIVVIVIIVLAAVFAPFVSPYEPNSQNLRSRLEAPSATHLLGTDEFGRDVLSRIIFGGRVSLQVGFISVGIALVIGGGMGLLGGYYGKRVDSVLMAIVDVLLALPAFLLALAIIAALGPGLINVMIAVGIANIPAFARITRSAVLTVREQDFVAAALAAGSSDLRVMLKHIIPNALSPVIVQVTLSLAGAILAAAGLSFLGMGAQPPTPEWGSMLSKSRPFIRDAHWAVTFPGLAIVITVLALNFVGDGLRDALDPRKKR